MKALVQADNDKPPYFLALEKLESEWLKDKDESTFWWFVEILQN
jgi:hypothetical protein